MVEFVEYTNSSQNIFQSQEEESMEQQFKWMKRDIQAWSDLLHISGGKLELMKCSLHVLKFKFKAHGRPEPVSIGGTRSLKIRDSKT